MSGIIKIGQEFCVASITITPLLEKIEPCNLNEYASETEITLSIAQLSPKAKVWSEMLPMKLKKFAEQFFDNDQDLFSDFQQSQSHPYVEYNTKAFQLKKFILQGGFSKQCRLRILKKLMSKYYIENGRLKVINSMTINERNKEMLTKLNQMLDRPHDELKRNRQETILMLSQNYIDQESLVFRKLALKDDVDMKSRKWVVEPRKGPAENKFHHSKLLAQEPDALDDFSKQAQLEEAKKLLRTLLSQLRMKKRLKQSKEKLKEQKKIEQIQLHHMEGNNSKNKEEAICIQQSSGLRRLVNYNSVDGCKPGAYRQSDSWRGQFREWLVLIEEDSAGAPSLAFGAAEEQRSARIIICNALQREALVFRVESQNEMEKLVNLLQVSNTILSGLSVSTSAFLSQFRRVQSSIGQKHAFKCIFDSVKFNGDWPEHRHAQTYRYVAKLMQEYDFYFNHQQDPQIFLDKYQFLKSMLICHNKYDEYASYWPLAPLFNVESIIQVLHFKDVGRSIVTTTVFQLKQPYAHLRIAFFKIDVQRLTSQTKSAKIVFALPDIRFLVSEEYSYETCLDKVRLGQMTRQLITKLQLRRSRAYTTLCLNMNQISMNPRKQNYELENYYNHLTGYSPKQDIFPVDKVSTLRAKVKTYRIIHQAVKKVDNQFLILTIKQNLTQESFNVEIYVPATKRHFVAYFYKSELGKLSSAWLTKYLPAKLTSKIDHVQQVLKNQTYAQFVRYIREN